MQSQIYQWTEKITTDIKTPSKPNPISQIPQVKAAQQMFDSPKLTDLKLKDTILPLFAMQPTVSCFYQLQQLSFDCSIFISCLVGYHMFHCIRKKPLNKGKCDWHIIRELYFYRWTVLFQSLKVHEYLILAFRRSNF